MVDDRDDDKVPTLELDKTRLGIGDLEAKAPALAAGTAMPRVPEASPETPQPLPPAPSVEIEILGAGSTTNPRLPPLGMERYTLGAQIGQGGMGEVLLAHDEHIGREVAVKRIRATAPSEEQVSRFVREARVQGRLEHPAVVPVHDLAVDRDGRPYFVMKRLAGIEMHEVLRRIRAGEDPDDAGARRRLLRAFADVCLAVEFAHNRGIIHRDLKPANIMLGEYGEVYVLDWGVARTVAKLEDLPTLSAHRSPTDRTPQFSQHDLQLESGETRAGELLGTPAYMAPEQLAGDVVGPAADIYALGCILFEIAAGEPLHPRTRTIGQALTLADARPSQRRPDSPPELDAICLRATAIEAEERFPTARALGAAVQAYLDGNRDVAVRSELALQHVEQARAAIARGNAEQDRAAAMREAGRALALDPTSIEAADIVTRLMLQPPRDVPAEVEQGLVALESSSARAQGKLAAIAMLGYLAFVPVLLWTGIEEPLMIVALTILALAGATQVYTFTRNEHFSPGHVYVNACINALLIAIIVRLVGPLVVAPILVVTTLMAYAAHPRFGRIPVVSVILASSVGVPWILEILGVLAPTYSFESGKIILHSPNLTFSSLPAQLGFALLLVMAVAVVAFLLRTIALRQRDATRRLELHAWHLRQIVPTNVR
jgi:serine/threonine-protein kinase